VEAATAVPARALGLTELFRLMSGFRRRAVIDDGVQIERVLVGGDVRAAV
jgi:hypothetical protein